MAEEATAVPTTATSSVAFWGVSDSNVRWCESDYVVTPYVAEFWNTLTSFALLALGFIGARLCYRHAMIRPRFFWAFMLLGFTGIGSTLFHLTNRYWAQVLDELPMLYFNLVTSINLLESNTRLPQYRWLPAVMWAAAAAITLVYMFLPEFYALFLTTYSGLVVILILLSFKRVYFQVFPMLVADSDSESAKSALRRCRLLLWSAFFFYGVGSIMWGTENALCPPNPSTFVDPERVKTLNRIQLHAWWHIFAGIGTYLWIWFHIALHASAGLHILPSVVGTFSVICSTSTAKETKDHADATSSGWHFPHVRLPMPLIKRSQQ